MTLFYSDDNDNIITVFIDLVCADDHQIDVKLNPHVHRWWSIITVVITLRVIYTSYEIQNALLDLIISVSLRSTNYLFVTVHRTSRPGNVPTTYFIKINVSIRFRNHEYRKLYNITTHQLA